MVLWQLAPCRRLQGFKTTSVLLQAAGSRAGRLRHPAAGTTQGPGRTGRWCAVAQDPNCSRAQIWDALSQTAASCSSRCTDGKSTPRWTLLGYPPWLGNTSRFLNVLCLPSRTHCCDLPRLKERNFHLCELQMRSLRRCARLSQMQLQSCQRTNRCCDCDLRVAIAAAPHPLVHPLLCLFLLLRPWAQTPANPTPLPPGPRSTKFLLLLRFRNERPKPSLSTDHPNLLYVVQNILRGQRQRRNP